MGAKSVAIAFAPARAPSRMPLGRIELGLGIVTIPTVDADALPPVSCGEYAPLSNINKLAVAAQPRVRFGLGAGFAADAGWIPPIPISGVKANLFGIGADWSSPTFAGLLIAGVGLNAAFGTVKGSFTCDDADVQDPNNPSCYQGEPSDDSFKPAVYGADASLAASFVHGTVRPYVGGGYTKLKPHFQVNYTNSVGFHDNTELESDLNAAALFGGVTWDASHRWSFTGQVFSLVSYGTSASLTTRYALGK